MLIVGAGRIGRETARLAEAFGANAVLAGRDADLDALLPQADIVSIHAPLTAETRHLIDARRLALMRPTRRADQHRPRPRRRRGRAGRGASQTARSPAPGSTSTSTSRRSPRQLLALENVVLAPHLGSATRDTRIAMGMLCVSALRAVLLEGRTPANVVA